MAYPTVAEIKAHLGISDTTEDTRITTIRTAAIADVESYCGRTFTQAGSVTTRYVRALDPVVLRLPPGMDISTSTGLVIDTDTAGAGTYGTSWTITTDFLLEPLDGYGYDAASGWAWDRVTAVGTKTWPVGYARPGVKIQAKWGWAAVPTVVAQATLFHAANMWKLKDAPFGLTGGDLLGAVHRVKDAPAVASMLARFVHPQVGALIG